MPRYVDKTGPVQTGYIHDEMFFNMGKIEVAAGQLAPLVTTIKKLKASYVSDRSEFIDKHLAMKVPATRANVMADVHFREQIAALADHEADIENLRAAIKIRTGFIEAFRTMSSDVRKYDG